MVTSSARQLSRDDYPSPTVPALDRPPRQERPADSHIRFPEAGLQDYVGIQRVFRQHGSQEVGLADAGYRFNRDVTCLDYL